MIHETTPGPAATVEDSVAAVPAVVSTVTTLVIDALDQENLCLVDQVRELEAEVRVYRDLAHTAVHALHDLTVRHARLRERLHAFTAEARQLVRERAA
jgi:hypothetical protein